MSCHVPLISSSAMMARGSIAMSGPERGLHVPAAVVYRGLLQPGHQGPVEVSGPGGAEDDLNPQGGHAPAGAAAVAGVGGVVPDPGDVVRAAVIGADVPDGRGGV